MINFDYYIRDKRETGQEGLSETDIFTSDLCSKEAWFTF